jgi:chemotaxis signal transduction protein
MAHSDKPNSTTMPSANNTHASHAAGVNPYGSKRMIEAVLPYMRQVQLLERELHALEMRWDLVESTARMVCPEAAAKFLPTLKVTRGQFSNLQERLLQRVAETQVANKHFQLISHAQVMVDLLVRGLYERTADVGFIATDPELVALAEQPSPDGAARLQERLEEYRSKYTVYDDIVLLDAGGTVLCRLEQNTTQEDAMPSAGASAWFQDARNRKGYAQSYETDELFAGQGRVLLFAHRVESARGICVGVVVLKFALESELRSIFEEVDDGDRHAIVTLVDQNNVVIASSRPSGVAAGDVVDMPDPAFPVVLHHDAEYLACSRTSRGYLGYEGLPWRAQAMTKLDTAFRASEAEHASDDTADQASNEELLRAIMNNDAALNAIIEQAAKIEQGLEQVTWNGKLDHSVQSNSGQSTSAVFDQIHETGKRTTKLFSEGITRLCRLAAAGRRTELQGRAKTAINILDRNLYERANDCRWWALSSQLRGSLEQIVANPADSAAHEKAEHVLEHLNGLYSVYRRIALCNDAGAVVAVSKEAEILEPGVRLPEAQAHQVRGLASTQGYAVSPFEPSPLADGKPTYVFMASIRHPANRSSIGSVALAIDADQEFTSMLGAAVPPNGSLLALFLRADGRVLASTCPQWQAGETFPASDALERPAPGDCSMQMITVAGDRYLAVIAASNGYREFKRCDGYTEPLLAIILQPLPIERAQAHDQHATSITGQPGAEMRIGLFRSNDLLLGINTEDIIEAIRAPRIVPLPGLDQFSGVVEQRTETGTRLIPVMDFRFDESAKLTAEEHRDVTIVVVNHSGTPLGLWVNRLLTVIDLPATAVKVAANVGNSSPWIVGFVSDASPGSPLITIVDINKLEVGELQLPTDLAARMAVEAQPDAARPDAAWGKTAGARSGLINESDEVTA